MTGTPAIIQTTRPAAGPVAGAERITSLDTIRGVAILGILSMNALLFGLDRAAYFNVSADGIGQPFDWIIGVLTMVFIDQKMMALFSLLFGVGVVIYAERARAKGRRVAWLSLQGFALLFAVGIAHTALWDGDTLALYAICAPVVLLVGHLPVRLLVAAGVALALAGTVSAPLFQSAVGGDPVELGNFWFADADSMSTTVEAWFYLNAAGRALGLMLIGVALYRLGIVQGKCDDTYYRRLAIWGLGVRTAVTAAGSVWHIATDWSADHAFTGTIPTGLGTIPMALGYMAIIILQSRNGIRHLARFRNAGQMALTSYLTQTVLGLITLGWLLADVDLTRTMIAMWILGVWALQLWWSTWWLERFRYGPVRMGMAMCNLPVLAEMQAACGRFVVIRNGKLVFTGTAGELFAAGPGRVLARPEHPADRAALSLAYTAHGRSVSFQGAGVGWRELPPRSQPWRARTASRPT